MKRTQKPYTLAYKKVPDIFISSDKEAIKERKSCTKSLKCAQRWADCALFVIFIWVGGLKSVPLHPILQIKDNYHIIILYEIKNCCTCQASS